MCQKLAPIVAALLMAFGTAHARSPFDQILAGDIERIAICGFGDAGSRKFCRSSSSKSCRSSSPGENPETVAAETPERPRRGKG